jgi:hypothetical protein
LCFPAAAARRCIPVVAMPSWNDEESSDSGSLLSEFYEG